MGWRLWWRKGEAAGKLSASYTLTLPIAWGNGGGIPDPYRHFAPVTEQMAPVAYENTA